MPETLYEHGAQPLLPPRKFAHRMLQHFLIALAIVIFSLVLGMLGYHWLGQFNWVDSFLNAAMLLGGMGPVGDIPTTSGKLFAGIYALYAGLVLIAASALLLTPVLHRVMHTLHLEGKTSGRQQ